MKRIPTLDGWRGIAILLVLIDHYQLGFCDRLHWYSGQHGVQIFFVLSGFLITSQLISHENTTLRSFYIRRAFRILPAALLYLGTLSILLLVLTGSASHAGILSSLLFYRNYVPQYSPRLGSTNQFWSLSLEEQFYFFWPVVFLTLRKRRAAILAFILIGIIASYRFLFWGFYPPFYAHTEIRADGLLVGCVLAIVLDNPKNRALAAQWLPLLFWPALVLFCFDNLAFKMLIPLHESMAIAVMIGATSQGKMAIARLLDWKPLTALGVGSYSVYLWQQLCLRPEWGWAWPVLLFLVPLISYACVEQPARRIGKRMSQRWLPQKHRTPV